MNIKIGLGYDVHCLIIKRPLILGGIHIPHTHGLLGHSDADVLIHSICDALLGAASLGDIGKHFPDTSKEFLNIDSSILLKRTILLIENKGYKIGNIDATIIAQSPRLSPYIQAMRDNLSKIMGIDLENISIKATTTEKLGFEGRKEGISSQAIALIYKS